MKKQYKLLTLWIVIVFVVLEVLKYFNVVITSPILNIMGGFFVLLPICLLLYFLSKDEERSKKTRMICKGFFWFISIVFVSAVIGEVIENLVQNLN